MDKIGLVLSGGGAKGAYQVGLMKALNDLDIQIDAIAGASIGALNSAVLASAPNIRLGTENLEKLWNKLPHIKPLQFRGNKELASLGIYLSLLVSAGLKINPYISVIALLLKSFSSELPFEFPVKDFSLLTDRPLQEMINEFLNFDELQKSIPFYVSVFEQDNLLQNSLALGAAELFGIENKPSVFKHIQSLPLEQQKETILASAAIPLLFQSRRDENGTTLTDGGQGGWIKAQGNTPIRPLIDNGCKWVIVSHLSNGSLWHRHDFTDATCIEIRPNPSLDMGFSAMFDFSEKTIYKLVEAGYEDTMQQVGALKKTLSSLYAKRSITEKVEQIIKEKRESEVAMDLAMERLRNS